MGNELTSEEILLFSICVSVVVLIASGLVLFLARREERKMPRVCIHCGRRTPMYYQTASRWVIFRKTRVFCGWCEKEQVPDAPPNYAEVLNGGAE